MFTISAQSVVSVAAAKSTATSCRRRIPPGGAERDIVTTLAAPWCSMCPGIGS